MAATAPTRIAILGGGCGALSTAFWLTDDPARRAAVEVTVHVQGWRLGGKGASGRNRGDHDRIEEHGLHLFLGFYEHAFTTLRRAYDALAGSGQPVFPGWRQAFSAQREITLWLDPDEDGTHDWRPWIAPFPQLPGDPGDPHPSFLDDLPALILDALEGRLFPRLIEIGRANGQAIVPPDHGDARAILDDVRAGRRRQDLIDEVDGLLASARERVLGWLHGVDQEARLLGALIELGYVVMRGYVADILPHGQAGFARIDHLDFKAWLRRHGASAETAWSEPIRALYELAFAFKDGRSDDPANALMAAGAGLNCLLRLSLGYKDAPVWRMNAGMGDTVFTPLYLLLRARGVRFAFFHRVQALRVDSTRRTVRAIELSRQVDLAGGSYDPLVVIGGLGCWPSSPRWEQITGGSVLAGQGLDLESPWCLHEVGRETLELGRDFDQVVLAIPPAAAAPLTAELGAIAPAWRAMLDGQASVATHSVQLWLRRDLDGLGWTGGGHDKPVSTSYRTPLESWADMSHLIARESWGGNPPASCQYLCGVVPTPRAPPPIGTRDGSFQAQQDALGQKVTVQWAQAAGPGLWPDATGRGGIDPALIVSVYDHVNVAPSELYVQTLPGSTASRLPPGWDGIANLVLAGDWTITSINGGSAEAAFESGRAAADALASRLAAAAPVA